MHSLGEPGHARPAWVLPMERIYIEPTASESRACGCPSGADRPGGEGTWGHASVAWRSCAIPAGLPLQVRANLQPCVSHAQGNEAPAADTVKIPAHFRECVALEGSVRARDRLLAPPGAPVVRASRCTGEGDVLGEGRCRQTACAWMGAGLTSAWPTHLFPRYETLIILRPTITEQEKCVAVAGLH